MNAPHHPAPSAPVQIEIPDLPRWRGSRVVFLGKTGVGKTTTINALFGLNLPTDNARACTRSVEAHFIPRGYHSTGQEVVVMDTPGISESLLADRSCFPLIESIVAEASCVVWLFQADTRIYRPDQVALHQLADRIRPSARWVFGLNRVDQAGPMNWDRRKNRLSPEQERSVREMAADISRKMEGIALPPGPRVIPFSAKYGLGLPNLRSLIFEESHG